MTVGKELPKKLELVHGVTKMNEKTLKEIDYYRIREEVAGFCVSEEGKKSLLERNPLTDLNKIEFLKNASREWCTFLSAGHAAPVGGWEPISGLNSIIKTTGMALTLQQVKALGQFCTSVKKVKQAINLHSTDLQLKVLPEQVAKLPDITETEKLIFRIITPDGEMRDLPEIAAIRKQIASLNGKIKTIMQKYTSDQKLATALESTVPVLRGGRQVLAVKSNQQNRIPGIIHEVSQSAQTVYIEPEEAVRCSNELVQKENELIQVINKILADLTLSLQPSIPIFRDALPLMQFFDTTLAAARWGNEHNCVYAQPVVGKNGDEEPPYLVQARHPLLGEKAVPIDVRFMDGKRVLIITGPNTGGKTVTLKTFALFSVLNQTGLPVPASEGTRLPVFKDLYADIGDDQSLDQNLSTFSGHMKNIAEAVTKANAHTLVLLDELGSGTDPQEGTAISMAVLDELIKRKSFVLVTTHQGILKNYGYTNPSCVNASVEFDQKSFSPSYHLLMGVPGESHALDIAARSGLPGYLVKSAKNYIATEQADVSALIRGLNRKHVELNKVQKEAEQKSAEAQEKYERLKEKELNLRRKENELKKGKQQELNDFLIHSRRQLENLVRTLKEGEITREKTLAVKQYISELTKETERLEAKTEAEEEKLVKEEEAFAKELATKKHSSNKKTKKKLSNAEALKYASSLNETLGSGPNVTKNETLGSGPDVSKLEFVPGAFVVAGFNKNEGVLLEETRKGVWNVQFGSVKMSMKQKDLKLVAKKNNQFTPSVSIDLASEDYKGQTLIEKETPRPVFELRLLGMRSDEAIRALERQLDLCILNNFPHFSVIHGKGDGILQQAVKDYLSNNPVVQSFEQAPAEDGGAGKTYVTLK